MQGLPNCRRKRDNNERNAKIFGKAEKRVFHRQNGEPQSLHASKQRRHVECERKEAQRRKELAYRAGFSLNSISTGIARQSIPAADVACRIADAPGVSVEFLVMGKSKKSRKSNADEDEKVETQLAAKKANLAKYMDKYAILYRRIFRTFHAYAESRVRHCSHRAGG